MRAGEAAGLLGGRGDVVGGFVSSFHGSDVGVGCGSHSGGIRSRAGRDGVKGVHARGFCEAERRIAGSIFTVVQRFPRLRRAVPVQLRSEDNRKVKSPQEVRERFWFRLTWRISAESLTLCDGK